MSTRLHLFTPAALLLLAWGVFSFGAVYTWAHVPLLIFAIAVAALGFLAARRTPASGLRPYLPLAISLTLFVAAGTIQVAPLPASAITAVSPARDDADYAALFAQRTLREHDATAPMQPPRTLSIEPSRTVLGLSFAACLTALLLGAANGFSALRPTTFVRGVIVIGAVASFVEIAQLTLTGEAKYLVYGFFSPFNRFMPAAPFLNRNHTAGFLVMTTCMALAYLASSVTRGWERVRPEWRDRILWFGSTAGSESLLVAFAVMVMVTAVVATQSRSGAVTLGVSLMLFGIVVLRRRWSNAIKALVIVVALAAFGTAASFAGLDTIRKRLGAISTDDPAERSEIWRTALAQAKDFPLAGTGLNTFGVGSLHYQDPARPTLSVEAHNDYLQLASEGGLLLGVPAVASILSLIALVRRRFKDRADDTRIYWLRVGAVIALVAIACQSVVEFTLQMPGATTLFVLLAAIAVHRSGR